MKRLSNISPFILLLLPVFIMMLLSLGSNTDQDTRNEAALKTSSAAEVKSVSVFVR